MACFLDLKNRLIKENTLDHQQQGEIMKIKWAYLRKG